MKGVVLYDDNCKLCRYSTMWLKGHVADRTFDFDALSSKKSKERMQIRNQESLSKDEVIYFADGKVYSGWRAVEEILLSMKGVWRLIGKLLLVLPNGLKATGYRFIARNRYRLQKRKKH